MRKIEGVEIDKGYLKKPRVIIFHGFDSSCENARYQNLPFEIVRVDVDHKKLSWQEVHDIYDNLIMDTIKSWGSNIILLGHSLGGWWARYFVKQYGLKAVLLNPLIDIKTTETKIPDRDEYEKHMADIKERLSGSITYYIELPDEVIKYEAVIDGLHNDGEVIIKQSGHHRIRWPEIIPQLLISADNHICL